LELTKAIKNINTLNIPDKESLKHIVQEYASFSGSIWYKHSKAWWNENCQIKLTNCRFSKTFENWNIFKEVAKKTKYIFFDDKIQKIISKNQRPWNLMNWIK